MVKIEREIEKKGKKDKTPNLELLELLEPTKGKSYM